MNDNIRLAMEFERFCYDLFKSYGFNVIANKTNYKYDLDLIVQDYNNSNYIFEIKFYRTSGITRANLSKVIKHINNIKMDFGDNYKYYLIAGSPIDKVGRELLKQYNINAIDINDIRYLAAYDLDLTERLNSIINDTIYDWSRGELKPSEDLCNFFDAKLIKSIPVKPARTKAEILIDEFKNIKPGITDFRKYEKHCTDVLKFLFDEHLGGWKEQNRTDDDLHQMDLICRVKRGNEFWDSLKEDFNSRYVLFEFKNYKNEIEQTQIYTTEKYLFGTALRKVAFIISRIGASKNAYKAAAGVLKESGKFIIPLTDKNLIEMIEAKEGGLNPEDNLYEILDNILLTLPK